MKTPEIQAELTKIAVQMRELIELIAVLSSGLSRRPQDKRAPPTSHMTPALKLKIMRLYKNRWSQKRIAEHLKINQGRVSEVVRGKRT